MGDRVSSLLARVRNLEDKDPYAPEVRRRFPDAPAQALAALAQEVTAEIASSLGRAGRKLADQVAALNELGGRIGALSVADPEREILVQRFKEQRQAAARQLRNLCIQREALGFLRHADLYELYRLPDLQDY